MMQLPRVTGRKDRIGCDQIAAGKNMLRLSRQESRRIAAAAQLSSGHNTAGTTSPLQILEQVGAIQLDAMQRVDKSHRLVCFARSGAIKGREQVDKAFWTSSGDAVAYETWAQCRLPRTGKRLARVALPPCGHPQRRMGSATTRVRPTGGAGPRNRATDDPRP